MSRKIRVFSYSAMTLAIAVGLTACGGGGGGGNVIAPTTPPPVNPPPTSGPQAPVVGTVSPNLAVAYDVTNTAAGQAAGFNGAGVTIGVVDSGVVRNNPALYPRVVANLTYVSSTRNDLTKDDVVGHGTSVSHSMAGLPWGSWPGGVATGSNIVSARIINDTRPTDDGSGQGNEVSGALGLEPIHNDLIARGVKIMNNSWGGLYWTNLNATAPIAAEYRKFIIQNGGLVVFATGNEGRANPTDMSSMPSKPGPDGTKPAADLEVGWLAVGALASGRTNNVSGDTTSPYMTAAEVLANPRLAYYSNACGFAMRYCLVAPGDVVVPGKDDPYNAPTYWRTSGTSLAAPQVSGAAALVWQAFPYFSNDLVRQTILGTAKDIGAPGVDAVFGYGLLDVGKAVKGPAKLDWGSINVNNPLASTFSNDISGAGGINKLGAGTLTLSGTNTYSGDTNVQAGTLVSAKNIPGNATTVSGATLSLPNSGVVGNLSNGGQVSLTGAGGHTVGGNYVQGSTATLSYLVGAPLLVTGTASLNGTLQVAGKVAGYTHTAKETVVSANGGLSGTFANLTATSNVLMTGTLSYDANKAYLNLTRLDVAATAAALDFTPMAVGGATRVEGAFGGIDSGKTPNGAFNAGAGVLQSITSNTEAENSLASLNGELHTADLAFTRMTLDGARLRLDRRLDTVGKGGMWYDESSGSMASTASLGMNAQGWTIGQDVRLSPNWLVGGSVAEQRGFAWNDRADRARNRQVQASLYSLVNLPGGFYLSGTGSMGQLASSANRQIALGAYGFDVASNDSTNFRNLSLQAGRPLEFGLTRVTPYAGVQSLTLDRSGFVENGALGFGLKADASRVNASHGIAGLRVSSALSRYVDLFAYSEYQRLLSSSGSAVNASFTGFDLASPITGVDFARNASVFGFGLSRDGLKGTWSLGFDGRHDAHGSYQQASLNYARGF